MSAKRVHVLFQRVRLVTLNINERRRIFHCSPFLNSNPLSYNLTTKYNLLLKQNNYENTSLMQYNYSTQCDKKEPEKNVTVFQKMKQMAKDYWHILIPVHLITSAGWIAIFYTAATNGVDIVSIMEYFSFSEKYLSMIKNSSAGYWALTYALYKVFTPLRYTITVGGTTMAVRYLNKFGYLKSSTVFKGRTAKGTQSQKSATSPKEKCEKTKSKSQHTEPP